ncbi:MAG: lytic transglycosylase domain-containing protein [Methyloligellaceae bacterium]
MQAKRIIPATFIGLGALTAYLLYANSQKKPVETMAASVQEVTTRKVDKKQTEKKTSGPARVSSLKQSKPKEKAEDKSTKAPVELTKGNVNLADALKPVLSKTWSGADVKAFKSAYLHMRKDRYTKADAVGKSISDPNIRLALKWYKYKSNAAGIPSRKLRAFWKKHPDFPSLDAMKAAVESDLVAARTSKIRAYLKENEPVSSAGMLAKAILLMSEDKKDESLKIVRQLWHWGKPSRALDKIIIKKFGKHLKKEDYHIRAQRYLYEGKSKYVASALSVAKKLDASTRKTLDVHINYLRKSRKAPKKIKALPAKDRMQPNLIYAQVKRYRKKKKYEKAWTLLKSAPDDPKKLVDPDAWWDEKRYLILEALNKKKYQTAYDLAENHGQISINQLIDAEFLSGWIALRYLKKPKLGYKHFVTLNKIADGPRSRSQSHYWLGRSALAQGKQSLAKKHFEDGSKYFNTFYGQLSRQSINPHDRHIKINDSEQPTKADIRRFQNRSAVKIIMLANQAEEYYLAVRFFHALRYAITEPGERILLAEFAKRIGHTQQSVRIAKTAMFYGHDATEYAYPVHAMPKFKPLGKMPEKAFSFAIARQESEFNTKIVSHVGARGVMQVMPATAKIIARRYKIKYSKKKLSTDPSYNVSLGAIYITERLRGESGSYIKSIAGYNAGPGRVRQWVRKIGDPSRNIDPIDWIERIPFRETRNYVKKVLANMQVYRALLGNPKIALQLRKDLYRGRKDRKKATKPLIAAN